MIARLERRGNFDDARAYARQLGNTAVMNHLLDLATDELLDRAGRSLRLGHLAAAHHDVALARSRYDGRDPNRAGRLRAAIAKRRSGHR